MERAFAVVTGGGTAGHVLPALAVADALVAAGHPAGSVHYVGCTRGIETELLPATPYPHTFYDVVGFQRELNLANVRRNAGFAPKLWRARSAAIRLVRELRPQVVVSVGGYASMPAVLAARKLDIPIVVVSYDRTPGRASRAAARHAAACAVAFPGSPLPRAELTGAPLRQAILAVDRTADRARARQRFGIPDDRFLVAVMGGSLGSSPLNAAVAALVDTGDAGLAVRHAVGRRFLGEAGPARDGSDGVLYQPVGYEPDMAAVYAAADLFVGRGGASTVHEVAVTGVPAILVPWAGAAENHQHENVRWLSDVDAAVLLPETDLDRLPALIADLRHDPGRRAELAANAARVGEIHHQASLAALVERVAAA